MATPSANTENPIGAELRRLRATSGMTLKDFARHVAVPWQTLQAYETGRVVPPADRLLQITHATRRAAQPFRFEHVARTLQAA